MRFEYSQALETALAVAGGMGRHLEAVCLEPAHLLWALTREEEGQACQCLRQAGLALETWKTNSPPPPCAPEEGVPISAAVRSILTHARELAGLHSAEGTITTDQALFALLAQEAELREQLEHFGLQFARLQGAFGSPAPALSLDEPLDLGAPGEAVNVARILDANANRAREALRVVEDHCRFVLNDAFLATEWKRLRHELTQALTEVSYHDLLQARDTLQDVGTELTTAREQERESLVAVAQANAKRLQEAVRTLEEVGKTQSAALGQTLEKLRYRSYTLEKAMVLGAESRERLADVRLYVLVTTALCCHSLPGTVREALAGGAQMIQLREKQSDDRTLLAWARDVRRLTRDAGALFIMNDRPDLALLAEADGVHLGQEDVAIREARRIVGNQAIVGVSTHDLDQVRRAILEGADYIGVGPTFASPTKSFPALAGLEFVRQATAETSLPAFALGGITLDNVDQALQAGARRIAVSHAICAAADPRQAAAALRRQLDGIISNLAENR